jgi:transcriptional regulator with XRE-family HTH domain
MANLLGGGLVQVVLLLRGGPYPKGARSQPRIQRPYDLDAKPVRPAGNSAADRCGGTLARVSTDPKDRWLDLGSFIREQRGTARLSLRRLSELAGISNPYLSQIERGLRRPSAEILQQIAKALRISAETLYVQAGILEAPTGLPDLSRAIMADQSISEEQKQALVRIYLSFRREFEDERGDQASGTPGSPVVPAGSPPASSDASDAADPAEPADPADPAEPAEPAERVASA